MKILQINSTVNSGSTGKIAEYIGNVFLNQGWESYIAFGRKSNQSKSHLLKIGNSFDVLWHKILTLLTDRHAFYSTYATKKLINQIEQIQPDIILLHNLHGYYINVSVLFKYLQKKDIPVIWTLFDCWAFTGHCTYFDDIACEKWITHCNNCPKINKYPQAIRDNSFSNYESKKELFLGLKKLHFVVHSAWLKNLVQQSFLKPFPIHHIPSGIDLNTFSPKGDRWTKATNKHMVLGVASIWDLRKGLTDFITLSRLLPEEYYIVLVGVSKKLQQKLPANITVINRTENQTQLASIYRSASVFLNPTTQDNFPTTNIEALACGTPVITYQAGGSAEAIDDNTGIAVEKGNIAGLQQAITTICTQWDLNKTLIACRARATQLFDANEQYQYYYNLANIIKQVEQA